MGLVCREHGACAVGDPAGLVAVACWNCARGLWPTRGVIGDIAPLTLDFGASPPGEASSPLPLVPLCVITRFQWVWRPYFTRSRTGTVESRNGVRSVGFVSAGGDSGSAPSGPESLVRSSSRISPARSSSPGAILVGLCSDTWLRIRVRAWNALLYCSASISSVSMRSHKVSMRWETLPASCCSTPTRISRSCAWVSLWPEYSVLVKPLNRCGLRFAASAASAANLRNLVQISHFDSLMLYARTDQE